MQLAPSSLSPSVSLEQRMGKIRTGEFVVVRDAEGVELTSVGVELANTAKLATLGLSAEQLDQVTAWRQTRYHRRLPSSVSSNNNNRPLLLLHDKHKPLAPPSPLVRRAPPATPLRPRSHDAWDDDNQDKDNGERAFKRAIATQHHAYDSPPDTVSSSRGMMTVSPPERASSSSTTTTNLLLNIKRPRITTTIDLPSGYENVGGVSCFCNAAVRALVCVPALRRALLSDGGGAQNAVECVLQAACRAFVDGETRFSPSRAVLPLVPKFHLSRRQEDAHEFLLAVLDGAGGSSSSSALHRALQSAAEKTLECTECGFCRRVDGDETFLVHSISLPPSSSSSSSSAPISLQRVLTQAWSTERVQVECERCNKNKGSGSSSSLLTFRLKAAPQVLALHLKRHERTDGQIRKNHSAVQMPLEMVLPSENLLEDGGSGGVRYALRSAVMHMGSSPRSGHYTALGRRPSKDDDDKDSSSSSWLLFDDERTIPLADLADRRRQLEDTAVLYLYERKA